MVTEFRDRHGLTMTAAIRVLLQLGFATDQKLDPTDAERNAAFREGLFAGLAAVQKSLIRSINEEFGKVFKKGGA